MSLVGLDIGTTRFPHVRKRRENTMMNIAVQFGAGNIGRGF